MRAHRIAVVDVFTDKPYTGNSCAVVFDAEDLSSVQMQAIAREMNLPETVFLTASTHAIASLRYFTPHKELPFAGHPTIGAVHAMCQEGMIAARVPALTVRLDLPRGSMCVKVEAMQERGPRIIMTQPTPTRGIVMSSHDATRPLHLDHTQVLSDPVPQVTGVGVPFLMIGVKDPSILMSISPDWPLLRPLCRQAECDALYIYAPDQRDPDVDLSARLLDPFAEFEDPFTGSACGAMAALALEAGLVKSRALVVQQGESVGRIGRASVDLTDQDGTIRVGGTAVVVLTGYLERVPCGKTALRKE
jgi:trans-2,3-dihydro-3-hydroxyanthranilate isomerase